MHVTTWCVIVFSASLHDRDLVYLQSVLQKVVWALGNRRGLAAAAAKRQSLGKMTAEGEETQSSPPPSDHLHDTSKWPTLCLASNQDTQPFKLVYVALVMFSSLNVMVFRSLQSNQASAETGNTTTETVRSWGMEGREDHFACFSQNKGYLKHLDFFNWCLSSHN